MCREAVPRERLCVVDGLEMQIADGGGGADGADGADRAGKTDEIAGCITVLRVRNLKG
jgi:hypothetical protein